jgi:hypothetical protein
MTDEIIIPAELPDEAIHPLVASDPERYMECKNGAIFDRRTHHFVANRPSKNPHLLTSETSALYKRLRKERAQQAIREGIEKGTKSINWKSGISKIAATMSSMIVDERHNKTPELAKVLLMAANLLPDRDQEPVQQAGMTVSMDADTAARIAEALARVRK